jgi:hypothetical protein
MEDLSNRMSSSEGLKSCAMKEGAIKDNESCFNLVISIWSC